MGSTYKKRLESYYLIQIRTVLKLLLKIILSLTPSATTTMSPLRAPNPGPHCLSQFLIPTRRCLIVIPSPLFSLSTSFPASPTTEQGWTALSLPPEKRVLALVIRFFLYHQSENQKENFL